MEIATQRKLLFDQCATQQHLHDWINLFLGIDFPDCTVDPQSNSNPMALLWEVYTKCTSGADEDFTNLLVYAARDSYKTLGAAVMELLALLHLGRNVAHMAAIESQAKKAQQYVKTFFRRPVLREFVTTQNERRVEISWYRHNGTGEILTQKEWDERSPTEQDEFRIFSKYVQIIIGTIAGANSEHVPFLCIGPDSLVSIKSMDETSNRKRNARTACGIFNRLAFGGSGSGRRSASPPPMVVDTPEETIEALSFNFETGELTFKPIIKACRTQKPALRLTFSEGKETIVGHDHPLYKLKDGFTLAKYLAVGDSIIYIDKTKGKAAEGHAQAELSIPVIKSQTTEWRQVVLGSLLGDGGIYKNNNNTGNPYLSEQHCVEQKEYLDWKKSILSRQLRLVDKKDPKSGYTGRSQVGFFSGHSPILSEFFEFKKTLQGIEELEALGLAVWYMDDGCAGRSFRLSTECFTLEQNQFLADFLTKRFGLNITVHHYDREPKTYYYLSGTMEDKRKLYEICKPFIHPTMMYKFDVSDHFEECPTCGKVIWYYESRVCGEPICIMLKRGSFHTKKIVKIEELPSMTMYDFVVADNHNFFADSVLNKNCLDELDLASPEAVEEAKMIPTVFEGKLPITFKTSTRKTSFGLVQQDIERAENDPDYKLNIRHWNLIDITESCPTNRHIPSEPKIPIWVDLDNLKAISEADYQVLNSELKKKFEQSYGYTGCLRNCRMFAMCRGLLATDQKSSSPLLRPIGHTANQFKAVSTESAKAQLMCWKPASTGLIYSRLDRATHMKTPAQMAELLTAEKYAENFTKRDLLRLINERQLNYFSGLDWGYTHNFAVVTGAKDGARIFIIDVISMAGLELAQKIDVCEQHIRPLGTTIFPDPEDPASIKTFITKGFRCVKFTKDVKGGLEAVRWKLSPAGGLDPEMYMLAGDEGCELLFKRMSQYHWKIDSAGRITDIPDEANDDECDAVRYLCQNLFGKNRGITVVEDVVSRTTINSLDKKPLVQNWMAEKIAELTNNSIEDDDAIVIQKAGKKGGFVWDCS